MPDAVPTSPARRRFLQLAGGGCLAAALGGFYGCGKRGPVPIACGGVIDLVLMNEE